LLITHWLAGMEQMDQILVLDWGRMVEQGRHDEPLGAEGLYAELWRLQRILAQGPGARCGEGRGG
jgi:ABC-type multidrug transport system fused ATPase/permease subunit